uniref:Transmembrane 9 superfamily member n=1 Tax=Pseudonaja textilis TaxID=8673 RepID=A0A670ZK00_PSETE
MLTCPFLLLWHGVSCFYVPGVAPINFHRNAPVEIKAVKLTSSRTQLPYEYYSLPFCRPVKIKYKAENLGEVLRGDRIVNTPFQVSMNVEKKCEVLCDVPNKPVVLTKEKSQLVVERIQEEYYVHLIADNLPVATRLEFYSNREEEEKNKERDLQFEHGYRLGFMEKNRFFLHNHLSFILYYHQEEVEVNQEPTYRVVRFEVIPQSIALADMKVDEKGVCVLPEAASASAQEIDPTKPNELFFTYSVHWEESDVKWASRWDTYLTMSDVQIHWFSIVNSVVVVFFLSGGGKQGNRNPVARRCSWKMPAEFLNRLCCFNNLFCLFLILMAGILPFGAMFIELFFIFSAIWENQFYYLFGFLFLVFIILVVSCSQISIVMVYFQLCAEDYRWWWRTFLVSGGSAFYVLIYAIFYFVNKLDIVEFIPSLLYFGYTALMVLSFWLLTGTIGFYAAYMFVRKIYAAVKID